ncbi:MAG TPA: magnesium transporter CorA family protein [Bacteroidales bacterium]|nr:magnesium transporter CorA family protein [Bacteroidales bacterium]HSA44849.1 magnesium transporter CorA family protein [Bacteroidales bacterium]
MIKIYKTFGGFVEIPHPEPACWMNVINPEQAEIQHLVETFAIPADLIHDILDRDERSRVEFDEGWTLVILRIPVESNNESLPFHTLPLGIIVLKDCTLTVCLQDNEVLPTAQMKPAREQYRQIRDPFNFILRLFLRSGNIYLKYLNQINQITSLIEQDLKKSIKNRELNKLLKMEKCLVYFITSIKANEIALEKLKNSRKVMNEVNEDLLEDAFIENRQALEISQIYADIQSGMMDAYASIISNNLNAVMRRLTVISIILMIPTLIVSIFGMNVPNFLEHSRWALPAILAAALAFSLIGVFLMKRRQ